MTTPSNGERSLGQIYNQSRHGKSFSYHVNGEGHDEALEAVAQHAIATSPLVKQLVGALEHCKCQVSQVADRSVHWYVKNADDALDAYEAAMEKANDE